jgi:hypothetical protein
MSRPSLPAARRVIGAVDTVNSNVTGSIDNDARVVIGE